MGNTWIMQELQPPIYISNLRIGEPVTTVTDILVTVVCFYAFIKLRGEENSPLRWSFRYYFLLLGLATLWGAFFAHAFAYSLSQVWKEPGWIMSTWAISLLAYAMISHHRQLIEKIYNILVGLVVIELLFVMGATIYTQEFKWAGFHSVFGLGLISGALSLASYIKNADKGSRLVVIAIIFLVISGIVFSAKLSIHLWFNHVDLTHVIMCVASYILYRGGEELTNPNKT